MHIYSLEFFITKLNVGSKKLHQPDLVVTVTCSDVLNFRVPYNVRLSAYNAMNKSAGCGKAVFFCMPDVSRLIAAFGSEIKIVVFEPIKNSEEQVGNGEIKWPGFEKAVEALNNPYDYIESEGKFSLYKDEETAGTIQLQMCLVYYGERIEVPIGYMGSALSIPINFRRKGYGKNQEKQTKSDNNEGGAWAPLFVSPKKAPRSIMDPGMAIYAEMSGIPVPPPINTLLTPEYIKQKLCGHKGCPGAQKFKDFGLGPLALEGSCLGTVASIKEVKPYGLYGMSQAYGTMDSYGAYGLFVKKSNKKRKSCCGSPDCPYTAFYEVPDEDPDELPEGEDIPPTPRIDEVVRKPKRCQCKHCKKDGSISSKQSSKNSTCGSLHCPKKTPIFGVACPYRLSAGADEYTPNPGCTSQA